MEAAFAELPLALFTTLAPLGAGAFIVLAAVFFTTSFSDEQLKKIDRMTIIPAAVAVVGFLCSFAHLASPLNAVGVFAGVGTSPLSNEIVAGVVFMVLALVYTIMAACGKLQAGARKGLAAAVAVMAVVFALLTGMAYLMDTIASWNTPLVPVQMLGFALVGGAALGTLVLALAGSLSHALKGSFKAVLLALAVIGLVLGVGAFAIQLVLVNGIVTAAASGAALVGAVTLWIGLAIVLLLAAVVLNVMATRGKSAVALAGAATGAAAIGIFVARLVFYAIQISVGL